VCVCMCGGIVDNFESSSEAVKQDAITQGDC